MEANRKDKRGIGAGACAALVALALPAGASGANWVIKGRGFGHGVGMSQYGAYGYAQHGRGYREIVGHYYKHTKIGDAGRQKIGSARLGHRLGEIQQGEQACGKPLRSDHGYRPSSPAQAVILRGSHGRRLAGCGPSATATGAGAIRVGGKGTYRGKLKARRGAAACW
jgi:stage II sporulation protein D